MAAANYQGYLAIEGTRDGDHLTLDNRGIKYAKGILASIGAGLGTASRSLRFLA
jgi:hypothetical protein